MIQNKTEERRFNHTIDFLNSYAEKSFSILDLGIESELSRFLVSRGYQITNTTGEDLDLEPDIASRYGEFDMVTAFEILEHLVSPFVLLKNLPAKRLIATVPLRLWFSKAYRNNNDPRDRHFHEFEDWQFDWLLEKSGWTVIKTDKWVSRINRIGIRPMLRTITPRYYAVYAERL